MLIDLIEVYYVTLPLIEPWRTAYGEDYSIHTILTCIRSGQYEGWGETSPLAAPTYSPEFAKSAYYLIGDFFAPALIGKDVSTPEDLLERIKLYKGNPFAKGGIESAWWMLKAQTEQKPLHKLLGGITRLVNAGADFGVQDSCDILLQKIQEAVDQGYKRVKLKVRHGWDLEIIQAVRSAFPNLTVHIDCNGGYSLDDIAFFKAVDRLNLAMIEQPMGYNDLLEHASLQKELSTPICLDESIRYIKDFEMALRLGSCRVLNIKYGRVGGLSASIQLHNMARDAGIPCWVGSMLESGIGAGINIELATLPNFTYPGDLFESQRFYHQDVTNNPVQMNSDCTFTPSDVPGIAYKIDRGRLEPLIRHRAIVRS